MLLLARLTGVLGLGRVKAKRRERVDVSSSAARDRFFGAASRLGPQALVVEFGTKRSEKDRSTHVHATMPTVPRDRYVMADIENGEDVDVIADLHALPTEWTDRFDAVVAQAVFEHLERPWIAAKEIARILAPGGIGFISTHQTFPLHGFPSDFFRFSKEALALIFADAGLHIAETGYLHRADIIPPPDLVPPEILAAWNDHLPSYVLVEIFVEKHSAPDETRTRPSCS